METYDTTIFKSLDENKSILIFVLILLGIYYTYCNNYIITHYMYLFDNDIFKLIIFIIITYISSLSPAIGVSLAIIMLVSLQLITYIKLKKELEEDIDTIELNNKTELNNKIELNKIVPIDMLYLDYD